ncbi:hypothetical protein D910_11739 [Dendroctonus ponderosae]|uniref:Uncharacterized protein n=1 Tax=Dendroctonus ponderosae TaxID=77166 RepID=U4UMV9_DENPD|nr:hypothetical protein D910_11739 [Dendroctonus ponderosae]
MAAKSTTVNLDGPNHVMFGL